MISQDKVSIISNSWGECEAEEGASDAHAENTLFEEAAIQGQSVLSAAGDYGSEDCDGATADGAYSLAVDDPGSQPFVTDVGGTSMTALGPPPTETTWDSGTGDSLLGLTSGSGAGGGRHLELLDHARLPVLGPPEPRCGQRRLQPHAVWLER